MTTAAATPLPVLFDAAPTNGDAVGFGGTPVLGAPEPDGNGAPVPLGVAMPEDALAAVGKGTEEEMKEEEAVERTTVGETMAEVTTSVEEARVWYMVVVEVE